MTFLYVSLGWFALCLIAFFLHRRHRIKKEAPPFNPLELCIAVPTFLLFGPIMLIIRVIGRVVGFAPKPQKVMPPPKDECQNETPKNSVST